jgi:hypothetical protein
MLVITIQQEHGKNHRFTAHSSTGRGIVNAILAQRVAASKAQTITAMTAIHRAPKTAPLS